MQYVGAFLIGGTLCLIGQILIDKTSLTPARILTGYVVAGVVLSAIGVYGMIADIGGAGLHIGVVHGGEHLGKLGGHVGDDGLRVAELFLDAVFDGLFVVEVLAHHLVGLEEESGLVSGLFTRLLGQNAELLDGLGLGGLEAGPLSLKIGDLVAGDGALGALVEVKGTRGNAGGYALALDGDHSR